MLAPRKGSAACGNKSTKILKMYISALRVPGASLQAPRGDIAHVGTVHTRGQCTRGDSAQLGTLHTWNSAHVGTVRTWRQRRECYDGKYFKKGSDTSKT